MEEEFGTGWRLGAPLTESAVLSFEASHGVELPEAYRKFVLNVANGALGPPFYSLVPLGEPAWANSAYRVTSDSLKRPFPLTAAWIWEGNENLDDEKVFGRIEEVGRAGILPLGTDGDGMDYVLVVMGEARGQVWMLTGEGALPVARDFAAWILRDYFPDARWLLDNRPRVTASG
jgi:hypothetical protein